MLQRPYLRKGFAPDRCSPLVIIKLVPLQNRVTPLGEIVSTPERGGVYGNRGCIHDATGTIVRRQATTRWIACRLSFRGWYRSPVPRPGKYTGLFFLDDASAFAAGHRPCALCRREDYNRVRDVLALPGADAIDALLDRQRNGTRSATAVASLPDGAFVLHDDAPHLVLGGALKRWSFGGYGPAFTFAGRLPVVTPAALVEVLRTGWKPVVPFIGPDVTEDGSPAPGEPR